MTSETGKIPLPQRLDKVAEHILRQLPKGCRILVIDSGNGAFAHKISGMGADITAIAPVHAIPSGLKHFPILHYDGRTIPFPDHAFDALISEHMIERSENPEIFLEETARVLKTGGACFHILPSSGQAVTAMLRHYPAILPKLMKSFMEKGADTPLARRILRILIRNRWPHRMGTRGYAIFEPILFSRTAWSRRLHKAGFQKKSLTALPAGILSRLLHGTALLYHGELAGIPASKTKSPPDFMAIAQTVRPFSMVPPAAIAFAAEQAVAAIARDIPGVIVECGTWKGGCSMAMLEAQRKAFGKVVRPVHMLDSFEGLPDTTEKDGPLANSLQENPEHKSTYLNDNCVAGETETRTALEAQGFRPEHDFFLHKGWFCDTAPVLASQISKQGIALLRLDGDWYESTMDCLTAFLPIVSEGGMILIDDYFTWDGCARAVHDYLSRNDLPYRIESLPNHMGAFFVKKSQRLTFDDIRDSWKRS
ncbi:MAG TPA: hypothetical protein DCW68_05560 [Rhodospirillaceae bacterium]|nr:MAG: hypothetical protein A2018_02095 [Alphaproteobacteria bacterium GWF2_58_20]HAU29562.1 hypothetical protein [Rhodospirillaceae bacterium]